MTTILLTGAIANKPMNAGEAWVRINWMLGLRRLGCDVYLVEQIEPETCVDEDGRPAPLEASVNLSYFKRVLEEQGLADRAALVGTDGRGWGLDMAALEDVAAATDLLVNISGHLTIESLRARIARQAYVDLDPGFTQFWHASGSSGARLEGHDVYFTVGENIGRPGCSIPTSGIDWRPLRPPIVLEEWPAAKTAAPTRFTTIATWRPAFGSIEHEGTTYGLKVHEFRKMMELPRRVDAEFELALDIHPGDRADRDALEASGWRIVDPRAEAAEPAALRSYVQRSGAEFSVAQGVYVETWSGWFSDRTVQYLASGKPALVQETGLSANYPVGEGLLAFATLEEAAAGVERIVADYVAHADAARALAEANFDSDVVLARFLAEAGVD
jgi:hypothetical protein